MARFIDEMDYNELKQLKADYDAGMRYNDIRAKYNLRVVNKATLDKIDEIMATKKPQPKRYATAERPQRKIMPQIKADTPNECEATPIDEERQHLKETYHFAGCETEDDIERVIDAVIRAKRAIERAQETQKRIESNVVKFYDKEDDKNI